MIGQIVSAIGGLATSYIDGKTAIQKANAEIKLKQATGEMDWEQAAISASNSSFKDELWTIVFVCILAANFVPALQETMAGIAQDAVGLGGPPTTSTKHILQLPAIDSFSW